MKFALGIFIFITLFSACTPKGVSPEIVQGIQQEGLIADSISNTYTALKSDFQGMAKILQALPESAKNIVPDYSKFESEVFDYNEKMLVYETDLREMAKLGQSFASEVEQGKYDRLSAIAKFEDTNKERRRIEDAIATFKKEFERLSIIHKSIVETLPNQGKDLPMPSVKK